MLTKGGSRAKGHFIVEVVLTEWLSFIIRWLHVVAGIAWIGSSFYFIHLDLSLKPRSGLPEGVKGDAWQVHGGGFYHMVKYLVAPVRMPDDLTWFKWEAYTTWLSGFALLVVVYYLGAEFFLIDRSVLKLSPNAAIGISVGTLLAAWLIYEGMCRSALARNELLLSVVGYIFLVGLTYGFTHVFSGRGAFTQIGALVVVDTSMPWAKVALISKVIGFSRKKALRFPERHILAAAPSPAADRGGANGRRVQSLGRRSHPLRRYPDAIPALARKSQDLAI